MTTNAITTIQIRHELSMPAATITDRLSRPAAQPRDGVRAIINYLERLIAGTEHAKVDVAMHEVTSEQAAYLGGDITVVQASAIDGDTITIGNTVLTAKTSASGQAQFNIGASNAAMSANLTACINAHGILKHSFVAVNSASNKVQLTSKFVGDFHSMVPIVVSGLGMTLADDHVGNSTSTERVAQKTYSLGR